MDLEPQQLLALGFMVASACALVAIGSKRSLPHAFAGRGEMLSKSDAAQFPITGSMVLFTLYVVLKLVPRATINWLLSTYLTLISVKSLSSVVRPYIGANIFIGAAAIAVGFVYFQSRNWIANNTLAFAIAIVGIEAIQLKTYAVSAILLCGLFLYDVFWVFGTDVMVTVAKGIDGPIKLVFPQTIFGDHDAKTMLGLGDIVIPGFFISQMFRFSCAIGRRGFYYHVAMAAYFLSLVNTMVVMVVFRHAQPALLYIVPWLLISTLLVAAMRGDLMKLLTFDQEKVLTAKHKAALVASGLLSKADASVEPDAEFDADLGQLLWLELLDVFGLEAAYKKKLVEASRRAAKRDGGAKKSEKTAATPDATEEAPEAPKPAKKASSPKPQSPVAASADSQKAKKSK